MRDGADAILEVRSISKAFGARRAVDARSFEVRRGEVFALLGPNGAGKTTTVRMLLGIFRPDVGAVSYRFGSNGAEGYDPARIGYLPEERGLYREKPILETLAYFGVLRGLPRREATVRAAEWLERLGLADRAKEKVDALSKGNQQRVQLAAAVLHRPALAVLDEPFSGLDPVAQDFFLDLVRALRDGGTTILLSAHQMALVERAADRLLLLNGGRAILQGSVEEVRRAFGDGGAAASLHDVFVRAVRDDAGSAA